MAGVWVIKIGGEIFEKDESFLTMFFSNLANLAQHQSIVLVHGGGPQLNRELQRLNFPSKFVNGLRDTSFLEMPVVEKILSGKINKFIVDRLLALGARAIGLSGREQGLIQAEPVSGMDSTGRPPWSPIEGSSKFLQGFLDEGYLPVVSPVSAGPQGRALNVNADDAATYLAQCLEATRLVFLTNVPGVLDKNGILLRDLTREQALDLVGQRERGIVKGGMIPKVNAAVHAVRGGVKEVWIASNDSDLIKLNGTRIHA